MGEAKRRKGLDPYFGRVPKLGRGLVVSSPIEIKEGILQANHMQLDQQEVRFALLFWDRLAWPLLRSFYLMGGDDERFLEQAGILSRPIYSGRGDFAQGVVQAHIQAFLDLEQRDPGAWALAQGVNSLLIKQGVLEEGRGALVELHRAIPVPDKDVPLNDILEFREKRRDDLMRLRIELEEFFAAINNASDQRFELRRRIESIDAACSDLLRIGREWRFPLRLSDLKASFEIRPFAALSAGAGAWIWSIEQELSTLNAALVSGLAAATASIKISRDFGLKRQQIRSSPYRYVYRFHREVF